MNTADIEKMLRETDVPDVGLPAHARQLKMALLSSVHFERPSYSRFLDISTSISMSTRKNFALGGAFVALALVVAVGAAGFGSSSTIAEAQELIKAAQVKMFEISPQMRAELETTSIRGSMEEVLAEAYAAPDLRKMTDEEYAADGNTTFTISPINQPDAFQAPTTYLSYTNPQGKRVVLGLTADSVLIMRIVEFDNGMIGVTPTASQQADIVSPENASGEWTAGVRVDAPARTEAR